MRITMGVMPPLYGISGFGFRKGGAAVQYHAWSAALGRPIKPWHWNSLPGFFAVARWNWTHDYEHRVVWRYELAQQWALEQGQALAQEIVAAGVRPDLIAHSLGARVALEASRVLPPSLKPRKVLLLQGAEYTDRAAEIAKQCSGTQFVATTSPADFIVDEGAERYGTDGRARPRGKPVMVEKPVIGGRNGVKGLSNWREIPLRSGHWPDREPANWPAFRDALA